MLNYTATGCARQVETIVDNIMHGRESERPRRLLMTDEDVKRWQTILEVGPAASVQDIKNSYLRLPGFTAAGRSSWSRWRMSSPKSAG